ncbi:hypothetical protein CHLRE_07g327050v5 [Chlamydomonas reinhardtii]|uniref:phytol kinase n=1 Tax=Chlamydomonas reinhardtii TaxID=3055 RepID=A0A2K3DJK3_CHLRE|nr:uncharacterized protein CHLRE_07g327050v5 [Chlamydomonas reinhardtii]PNW80717.1 hypothetical protein CHLRE_07g327050v5 [Chlamydomonas reinhardtii]
MQSSDRAGRLVRALIRADTLAVYSRFCARTLVPTRGPATRHRALPPDQLKLLLLTNVIRNLHRLITCAVDSPDAGLQQELMSALAHTQLLEHAARALMHAAQSTSSAGVSGSAASSASGPADESRSTVSAAVAHFSNSLISLVGGNLAIVAVCPRPRKKDALHDVEFNAQQLELLQQLRPLLAGRCVQLFAAWAGLCAAMAFRQQAADGSVQKALAPTEAQLQHGLPPALIQSLRLSPDSADVLRVATATLSTVIQVTVSGPCDLAIAQPPAGHDRLPPQSPQLQPQTQQLAKPSVGPSPSLPSLSAAAAAAAVPYSAVHAYGLLEEVGYCLACHGSCRVENLSLIAVVMGRLLAELPPPRAAVLLPGWWRLLAQQPSMLLQPTWLVQVVGELLRLQLNAPPPAAWAADATDAASAVAAGVDWPQQGAAAHNLGGKPAVGAAAAPIAAKAAASLALERDPSYSLRCALEAGLLPALERCLRTPQAWRQVGSQPDSACSLLLVVNSVLRDSGVWPAVLARGPVQQAVSLIATLGTAARLLQVEETWCGVIRLASQPGTERGTELGAGDHLCAYLAAMLEQGADVRALRERAQRQREGQPQPQQEARQPAAQRQGQGPQGQPEQPPPQGAATNAATTAAAAAAAAPTLHLNSVMEAMLLEDGSVRPSTFSIAWMAAAGGLPAPGSAADRQQQLLTSFAVYHWLPVLAKATREAMQDLQACAGRTLAQALLVGRLLMDVLWREDCSQAEAGDGAGAGAGGKASSPRPDGAWWDGMAPTGESLANHMHQIVCVLATGAVEPLLQQCDAWQQVATLDLLQSYWTCFDNMARVATYLQAMDAAQKQQRQQQREQQREQQRRRRRRPEDVQQNEQVGCGEGSSSGSGGGGNCCSQSLHELMLPFVAPLPAQRLAAAHGRQDLFDYLGAVAVEAKWEILIECANAAADTDELERKREIERRCDSLASSSDITDRLREKWSAPMQPQYPWLLSQGEVRAGLQDLMAAQAAAAAAAAPVPSGTGGSSSSSSSSGVDHGSGSGSSSGSSGGPVFVHKLCCNPKCCSLDGPSALIAPRSGKTCVRCRAATYCCGACQLADWRERHSGTCSGAAAGAAGAVQAGAKMAGV